MALSTPYAGQNGYKGNVTETQDDLNAWVERVHRNANEQVGHAPEHAHREKQHPATF